MQPGERFSTDRRGSPPDRTDVMVIGRPVVNSHRSDVAEAASRGCLHSLIVRTAEAVCRIAER